MRAYREKIKRPHLYQLRELALAFTFCGGFIDAYTFTERGGTLAAGQTGNIIFFGTDIAKHNLPGLTTKVATFLAYILGLIVVTTIALKVKSKYKRIFCILPIMFISLVVGFVPTSVPNVFVVPFLAFGIAMQTIAFNKIEGLGYRNTVSTGNLQKAVIAWTKYFVNHDSSKTRAASNYLLLVISFICGAIVSALLDNYFGIHTIWIAASLLVIINFCYGLMVYHRDNFYPGEKL